MKLKTQKAVGAETCGKLWRVDARNGKSNGLEPNCTVCNGRPDRAMMPVPRSITGGRGRSLHCQRRMTAMPRNVAFSFGGVRIHGLIASAFFTGAPCGEPIGSPFPLTRYFLHPHGVAHLVGRVNGFKNPVKGA